MLIRSIVYIEKSSFFPFFNCTKLVLVYTYFKFDIITLLLFNELTHL